MINKVNVPVVSAELGFYQYLQKINKIPSLSQEEEFLLAKAYLEQNDLAAAHRLVTSHLKLVAKIAVSYRNYGLPLTELVSEGHLGLMQAVKKYNPDLGCRLSTYAMWWIKASIQAYVLRSWSLVKIGTTAAQKKLFFSLGKIKHKITNLYSRAVTDQDFPHIAQVFDVTINEVAGMNLRLSGSDISLNNLVNNGDGSGSEMIEFLPETRPSQELTLISQEDFSNKQKLLTQAMRMLNNRELHILTERQLKDSPKTLDALSIEYKVSKERIRQIENTAFGKVQNFILQQIAQNTPTRKFL